MKKQELKNLLPTALLIGTGGQKTKYLVQAAVCQTKDGSVLRTTVFTSDDGQPYLTVFCGKESFVSWNHEAGKWSDAMLDKWSIIGYEWHQEDGHYHRQRVKGYSYDTVTSMQAGAVFFGGADDTLSLIDDFQRRIRDAATRKRHEKERSRIDAIMAQSRPLPPHFQAWADRRALPHYLYYRRKGKQVRGYCTACGTDIIMAADGVKHNATGTCPHCHRKIVFKAEGLARNVVDQTRVEYVQRIDGGRLMVREIDITKRYGKDYRHPEFFSYEGSRHIAFPDGKSEKYILNSGISWLGKWKPLNDDREYYAALYTPGLAAALRGTPWQYCAIERYAMHQPRFAAAFYLADSIKHPCVEYLCKMGFYRLLDERQNIVANYTHCVNWDGKAPRDVLKIRKDLIPLAVQNNVSSSELERLQFLTKADLQPDDPDLEWIADNNLYWQEDKIISLLKHMTLWKIRKYSERQSAAHKSVSISDIIGDWANYLRNAQLLEYNLHKDAVLFPKDLKKAHDSAMKLAKVFRYAASIITHRINRC